MTDEKRDLTSLKKRLQKKAKETTIGSGFGGALGSAFLSQRSAPPEKEKGKTVLFDDEFRQQMTDGISVWVELKGSKIKSRQTLQALTEMVLIDMLRSRVPDPNEGVVGLASSFLGVVLNFLEMKPKFIFIGEWDDEAAKLVSELEQVENSENPDEKRLNELRELTGPYAMRVPWELYEKAVERNQMEWMYKKAGEYGSEEKL